MKKIYVAAIAAMVVLNTSPSLAMNADESPAQECRQLLIRQASGLFSAYHSGGWQGSLTNRGIMGTAPQVTPDTSAEIGRLADEHKLLQWNLRIFIVSSEAEMIAHATRFYKGSIDERYMMGLYMIIPEGVDFGEGIRFEGKTPITEVIPPLGPEPVAQLSSRTIEDLISGKKIQRVRLSQFFPLLTLADLSNPQVPSLASGTTRYHLRPEFLRGLLTHDAYEWGWDRSDQPLRRIPAAELQARLNPEAGHIELFRGGDPFTHGKSFINWPAWGYPKNPGLVDTENLDNIDIVMASEAHMSDMQARGYELIMNSTQHIEEILQMIQEQRRQRNGEQKSPSTNRHAMVPALVERARQGLKDGSYYSAILVDPSGRVVAGEMGPIAGNNYEGETVFGHRYEDVKATTIAFVRWLQRRGIRYSSAGMVTRFSSETGARPVSRDEYLAAIAGLPTEPIRAGRDERLDPYEANPNYQNSDQSRKYEADKKKALTAAVERLAKVIPSAITNAGYVGRTLPTTPTAIAAARVKGLQPGSIQIVVAPNFEVAKAHSESTGQGDQTVYVVHKGSEHELDLHELALKAAVASQRQTLEKRIVEIGLYLDVKIRQENESEADKKEIADLQSELATANRQMAQMELALSSVEQIESNVAAAAKDLATAQTTLENKRSTLALGYIQNTHNGETRRHDLSENKKAQLAREIATLEQNIPSLEHTHQLLSARLAVARELGGRHNLRLGISLRDPIPNAGIEFVAVADTNDGQISQVIYGAPMLKSQIIRSPNYQTILTTLAESPNEETRARVRTEARSSIFLTDSVSDVPITSEMGGLLLRGLLSDIGSEVKIFSFTGTGARTTEIDRNALIERLSLNGDSLALTLQASDSGLLTVHVPGWVKIPRQ